MFKIVFTKDVKLNKFNCETYQVSFDRAQSCTADDDTASDHQSDALAAAE